MPVLQTTVIMRLYHVQAKVIFSSLLSEKLSTEKNFTNIEYHCYSECLYALVCKVNTDKVVDDFIVRNSKCTSVVPLAARQIIGIFLKCRNCGNFAT